MQSVHLDVGALVGNQIFPVTEGMPQLIQRTFECEGTEKHLRNCTSYQRNDTDSNCDDIRRNAYIVCQGKLLFAI